ncbi:hypothetical protein WKK_01005 [Weissella koreensis KACC 15510]|uniref:iron-sulfur cluster biosynthesis family protein n=1 Tax=Weissella koreensis TaxID=165096 RepID=UPI00021743D4|nr:iron-sulfur cluster biosynthesis family protein [Weissella koreensis]AEJ23077.1 hypothetical protein WKK_01005 [Weissella koreensis KACC 15510]
MYITFTDEAMKKISPILNQKNDRRIVLMYEDGVSPYSITAEGAMQISLVILILRNDQPLLPWFDMEVDSNYGKIPVKGYAKEYLAENMKVEVSTFGGLVITSEQGILDDSVIVRDGPMMA